MQVHILLRPLGEHGGGNTCNMASIGQLFGDHRLRHPMILSPGSERSFYLTSEFYLQPYHFLEQSDAPDQSLGGVRAGFFSF